MIIVLSPSKKLELTPLERAEVTRPELLNSAQELIGHLKQLSKEDVSALMKLSHKLTELNCERYQAFSTPFTEANAAPALTSFKGDVYDGLRAEDFTKEQCLFAQAHLRILSGLYGLLRPLDLIQPYRLEMGTRLATNKGKNLYEFWGEVITELVSRDIEASSGDRYLINLASNEYFKSIKTKQLDVPVLTVDFKEYRNEKYQSLMLYVKRARGAMARYIIQNGIERVADIKAFDSDGYAYNPSLSDEYKWVFTR
jgi:cytoplasmic iron level regulating protein YaaA (DUF328/UPF0246 family)